MRHSVWKSVTLPLAAAALLAGCAADDETIIGLEGEQFGGALFDRYVAIGNSITAGVQSAGINDSTQALAYPVLLARQANAPFNTPDFAGFGCPPPFVQPFVVSTRRVGGAGAPGCSLREMPASAIINNLAVPGARIVDAINHLANPDVTGSFNRLQTFVLGGRSQVEALKQLDPTLVTAFLGNNDVLGAAGLGNTALITPLSQFQGSLDEIVAAIKGTRAREAVFLGISPFAPIVQPGAYFFAIREQLPIPVDANCAPFGLLGPNPLSRNLVSFAILESGATRISCANDAPFLLNQTEIQIFLERIAQFNAAIKAAAEQNGFIFIDTNQVLAGPNATALNFRQVVDPQRFRLCQGLATATSLATFQAAVATTCPFPTAPNFFGSFSSFDAIHPALPFHQRVTNAIIQRLNAEQGLNIPLIG